MGTSSTCGTRSKVSFVSNPAQISLKHSSQLTNKTTLATSFVFIRHVFHCVLTYMKLMTKYQISAINSC
jgi:hypothetical protein